MSPIDRLLAEADGLARSLPRLSARTRASEAAHFGSAGRRRAGAGEQFWQYRRYADEDAADRIDWRRSGKGDNLYVRETEFETSRTFLFWCDPHPGFDWTGASDRPTKADRARASLLAVAALLVREGERVGVLGAGRAPGFGKGAVNRMAEDLLSLGESTPPAPRQDAAVVIASDFYDAPDLWADRLSPIAQRCRDGVLLAVQDPTEAQFPFEGRVRLARPGDERRRVIGRAEAFRDDYQTAFAARRAALETLATTFGWTFLTHQTDSQAIAAADRLRTAIEALGAPVR